MPEGKKLRKLRKAVNVYLLAQNRGFKDGDGCEEARRDLCGIVYKLNERAGQEGGGSK